MGVWMWGCGCGGVDVGVWMCGCGCVGVDACGGGCVMWGGRGEGVGWGVGCGVVWGGGCGEAGVPLARIYLHACLIVFYITLKFVKTPKPFKPAYACMHVTAFAGSGVQPTWGRRGWRRQVRGWGGQGRARNAQPRAISGADPRQPPLPIEAGQRGADVALRHGPAQPRVVGHKQHG